MHHQEFEPGAILQNTIKCFWYSSIEFGEQLSGFEVVPDGYAEIIFHFGSGCSIAAGDSLQPLPSPFLMGLLNQPAMFYAKNRLEIIGIRCYPWTVFDLLGLPPGKGGVRVFEHPVNGLHHELHQCILQGRKDDALAMTERYFLDAHTGSTADPVLFKAGTAMRKANGITPVNQLAAAAHSTVRTLERRFRQSSGHTIKEVSGLTRFEQARNQLWLNPEASLINLALTLGYTDQSHLSREFKRYSGTTPAAFARKAATANRILPAIS